MGQSRVDIGHGRKVQGGRYRGAGRIWVRVEREGGKGVPFGLYLEEIV